MLSEKKATHVRVGDTSTRVGTLVNRRIYNKVVVWRAPAALPTSVRDFLAGGPGGVLRIKGRQGTSCVCGQLRCLWRGRACLLSPPSCDVPSSRGGWSWLLTEAVLLNGSLVAACRRVQVEELKGSAYGGTAVAREGGTREGGTLPVFGIMYCRYAVRAYAISVRL